MVPSLRTKIELVNLPDDEEQFQLGYGSVRRCKFKTVILNELRHHIRVCKDSSHIFRGTAYRVELFCRDTAESAELDGLAGRRVGEESFDREMFSRGQAEAERLAQCEVPGDSAVIQVVVKCGSAAVKRSLGVGAREFENLARFIGVSGNCVHANAEAGTHWDSLQTWVVRACLKRRWKEKDREGQTFKKS